MDEDKLNTLAEQGDIDALTEELNFVRAMYRSGDISAAEYSKESALLELLIGKACDNADSI